MTDTVLAHRLVRGYLLTLDEACARLPYAQARELHEQIAGHLEEALPPDADDASVRAELDRLGRPYAIAAAAAGPVPPSAGRRLRNRLGHVRWRAWAVIGVLIAALGTGTGFLTSMHSAAPLLPMSVDWLYPADQAHATQTTADGITQTTIPVRFGQRQGIKLLLVNQSDWTQHVTGFDFQPFSGSPWQAAVQSEPGIDAHLFGSIVGTYVLWGAIPPHAARWVYLTWLSNICTSDEPGTAGYIDSVPLEVRVGLVTKTETISLNHQSFAVQGTEASNC